MHGFAPVLVVEDDREARQLLEQMLTANGYTVVSAQNGEEALEQIAQLAQPCLVLLDLMMPVMDGWRFLAELKRSEHAASSSVIVLSAVVDKSTADGHPFVQKPADFKRLLSLVEEYCPRVS